MALDSTVGGAQAESYLSVAEADTLAGLSLSSFAAAWTNAQLAKKENALRVATRDVEVRVGAVDRWSDAQALYFPRAVDVAGTPAIPFIPSLVRQATYEQAAFLLANQKVLDHAATRRARGMFSFTEDDGPSGTLAIDPTVGRLSPEAERLMQALIRTSSGGLSGSIPIRTTWNRLDEAVGA